MTRGLIAELAFLSLICGYAYKRIWGYFKEPTVTAKGYGVLLPLFLLGGGAIAEMSRDLFPIYAIIGLSGFIYWLDDLFEIDFRIRLALQLGTGIAIAYMLLTGSGQISGANLVLACAVAGALNMVLTNVINFSDGADLNLAVLITLTMLTILLFGPHGFVTSALIILAFTIPFAFWNYWPETLYFGDCGCFIFASLLTAITVSCLKAGDNTVAFVAIPIAWPVADAIYVFLLRVRNREDLLSRNYWHLYQQLQIKFGDRRYLVPQSINVIAIAAGVIGLEALGLGRLPAVTIAVGLVTPIVYLTYRFRYLKNT